MAGSGGYYGAAHAVGALLIAWSLCEREDRDGGQRGDAGKDNVLAHLFLTFIPTLKALGPETGSIPAGSTGRTAARRVRRNRPGYDPGPVLGLAVSGGAGVSGGTVGSVASSGFALVG